MGTTRVRELARCSSGKGATDVALGATPARLGASGCPKPRPAQALHPKGRFFVV